MPCMAILRIFVFCPKKVIESFKQEGKFHQYSYNSNFILKKIPLVHSRGHSRGRWWDKSKFWKLENLCSSSGMNYVLVMDVEI